MAQNKNQYNFQSLERFKERGFPSFYSWSPFAYFFNDLFNLSECSEVCNFVNDMTFYACDKSIEWFENNYMRLDQEKCHVLVTEFKFEYLWAKIGQTGIWESAKQKVLGVKIN